MRKLKPQTFVNLFGVVEVTPCYRIRFARGHLGVSRKEVRPLKKHIYLTKILDMVNSIVQLAYTVSIQ